MPTKITFNCASGETEEVEMADGELAAFDALRAVRDIVYGRTMALPEHRVTTTGTAPVELLRATIPAMTGYQARLRLTAIADNLALRSIEAVVVVGRGSGGAAIIQNASGQQQTVTADHRSNATAASWLAAPSIDGNDYVITVTGSAGRTIDWRLTGTVESFTPGGES